MKKPLKKKTRMKKAVGRAPARKPRAVHKKKKVRRRVDVAATVVGRLPTGWTAKKVAALATLTASHAGFLGNGVVSVKIVADAEMRKLNKMYRDKDKTTDVLSFGYTSRHAPTPAPVHARPAPIELGDIVISLPQVRRQAAEIGRDVSAEFALMVVHGVLHVLGHDHVTLKQETAMFSLQHEILLRSGWF